MSLEQELYKECGKFGKKIAIYMRANLEEAMQKAGSRNPQSADLRFEPVVSLNGTTVTIQIVASGDYWAYLDKGVQGTKQNNAPGSRFKYKSKAINSKGLPNWIGQNNIDPRKIMAEIQLKRKNGLSIKGKSNLDSTKKGLSFDKAKKQLTFVIATSIAQKGIKPRPFVQKTIKEVGFDAFKDRMAQLIGKNIRVETTII
jgi:hypothetical protein